MYRLLIGMAILAALLMSATSYDDSIRAWQEHRETGLRSPDGWLALVGLFWLKPGDNTIGSADSNDFVLPKASAPAHSGRLHLAGGKVAFIDPSGSSRMLSYDEEKPDIVKSGSVSFYVIKRGDRFAVRAKDSASPVLKNFQGMRYFPINPAFHFEATLVPDVKKISILNVLGQTEMQESPGIVEFTYQGKLYRLRPIYEDTAHGRTLYFLFKDTTNKTQTYPAGRMLNTPLAESGKVDLDFNHSYNPPCTFTPYATCPLPPAENRLTLAIEAGELRYRSHTE
jgi:hypothetical protein